MAEPYDSYLKNDSQHWEWHQTFIGQFMQHNYRVYCILDAVFKANPVKKIIEIGTGCGALTTYLALWGLKSGAEVMTVDIDPKADVEFLKKLGVVQITGDEYNAPTAKTISDFIAGETTFFLCDGGAKQAEFAAWVPRLKPGSIIAAHDLGVEFDPARVPEEIMYLVSPVLPERWLEMNAQLAIFKVK